MKYPVAGILKREEVRYSGMMKTDVLQAALQILIPKEILNTNAIAESTNAKIQMAAIKNRGARDLDFFFFRFAHFLNPVTSL